MSDIIGVEACAQELKRLLEEIAHNINAARANESGSLHATVLTEARKLVEFTNRTEPKDISDTTESENIRKIDQAAAGAMAEIFGDSTNIIIGRIQGRIIQLNQLEKAVRQRNRPANLT
ncbi:hypothetical protein JYT15_00685 [Acidimicrobium ferrooxidans]|nr:hypothetical protein [Acidimicrobium ferrooxidans]